MKTPVVLVFIILLMVSPHARAADMDETDCSSLSVDLQLKDIAINQDFAINQDTGEETFKSLFNQAECLRRLAAEKGAEWLKTESLLQRSLKEAALGHSKVATQLVMEARFQSVRALQQANLESEAWKRRVVK
jgi:hypothetical protein